MIKIKESFNGSNKDLKDIINKKIYDIDKKHRLYVSYISNDQKEIRIDFYNVADKAGTMTMFSGRMSRDIQKVMKEFGYKWDGMTSHDEIYVSAGE